MFDKMRHWVHRVAARLALQAAMAGMMLAGGAGGFLLFGLVDQPTFVWWIERTFGPATAKLSAMVSIDPLAAALLVPVLVTLGLGLSMLFVWRRQDTIQRLSGQR